MDAPYHWLGIEAEQPSKRLAVSAIQAAVAKHFTIPLAEMTSDRRFRAVARPRQVAMYLSSLLTGRSLPDIGQRFGGRDHTTVIHAIKQIEKLRAVDQEIDDAVMGIMAGLAR